MTVRVHRKERFTSVSNDIINNKEMSWEARGLLIYLLSKPPGWVIRNADLIKQSPAGRDKITSIVHELVKHGHIFRWQTRDSDGRIEWKSEIFETPEEMIEWKRENPDICGKFAHSIAETSSQTENHNGKTVHGGKSHHDGKTVDGKSAHHDGKTVSGSTVNGEPVGIVNTERSNTEFRDLKDLNPLTHSDPECVYAQESQIEESSYETNKTKNLPVLPPTIGGDNFSAAAPISPIEEFPVGPWGRDLFSIHPGFMAAVIAKWRKGDTQKAKTFGSMADEEVRGCIQKYWKKDWSNLQLDWTEYEESTKRLAQTVRDRMTQGVEITSQEQKILTDRVMGPEHLRPQTPYSVPQQVLLNPERVSNHTSPSISVLPVAVTGISESELEETRRAIEAARPKLPPMTQKLFEGGKPVPDFMTWLMEETKNHAVPGMALRLIAVSLARRPEIQTAYLHSVSQDF
jgi:hypothetical protein